MNNSELMEMYDFQVIEKTWEDCPWLVTMQYTVNVGGRRMRSGASCSYLRGAEGERGSREKCIEKMKENALEVLQSLVENGYSSGEDSVLPGPKTYGWFHRVDLYADGE